MNKMSKILLTALTTVALAAMLCACAKDKKASDNGVSDSASGISDYGQAGANASGTRLEAELNKNKDKDDDNDSNADKKNDGLTDDMSEGNDGNDKDDDKDADKTDNDNNGQVELKPVTGEGYAEALTESELKQTRKIALEYAKDKYSDDIKSGDLSVAEDSEKYEKYILYNRGNIIVYTFEHNGKTCFVTVARINADAEWEVLTKY